MVLYHFPPVGGVAMARNVANVQHLPASGWNPVVLATRDQGGLVDADALSNVPPGVRVLRARCPGPERLEPLVGRIRGAGRASHRADPGQDPPEQAGAQPTDARPARPSTGLWRLRRLVFFPDDEIGWLPFAVVAALRASRAGRFDAIYSTASPVTAHLVAGIVKRLTGVPWVAEFRDPWVGNPLADRMPWFHRRLQARIERWIAHTADSLVFVSPSTMRLYERRYPRAAPMVTITNGHDRGEALPRPQGQATLRPFRLVWTGALYRPAELELFLEALTALVARRPSIADELEVCFYGQVSEACRLVADRFADPPLGRMVHYPGFVSRRDALRAVSDADAALLMLGPGAGMGQFVPGKLFDYLGQGTRILAVLPQGDARDILLELDWGVVVDPNVAAIADALERLLATPAPAGPADPAGRFDRVALAGRLAGVLDRVSVGRDAAAAAGAS